jgi:hypothetical protein
MQFDVARNKRSNKLGIRCRSCATASNGLADIVDLCFELPISYASKRIAPPSVAPFRSSYPRQ